MTTIKKGAYRFDDELTIPSWIGDGVDIPIEFTTRNLFDYDGTTLVPDDTSSDLNTIRLSLQDGVLGVTELYVENSGVIYEVACYSDGVGWNVEKNRHEQAGYANYELAKGFGQIINVTEDTVIEDESVAAWFIENTKQKMFTRLKIGKVVYVGNYSKAFAILEKEGTATEKPPAEEYVPLVVTAANREALGFTDSTAEFVIHEKYRDQEGTLYMVIGIEEAAFKSCTNLTSIVIPDTVVYIGASAFQYCNYITSVVLGKSLTRIGDYAFHMCFSLTDIVIPERVTSIGAYAFDGCGFRSIIIPDSVTSIGNFAFSTCVYLTSVVIGDSVTSIGGRAFYDCRNLINVVLGNNVKAINSYAFSGCTSLTSIVIPDSVTSIGYGAFQYSSSLTSIKYRGTEAEWNAISKDNDWDDGISNYTITYNYTGD